MEESKELLIVKYGSGCVAPNDILDLGRINSYAEQLADISEQYRLVVVSSGSIAVGRMKWRERHPKRKDPSDQVLASMGSGRAVVAWEDALEKYDVDSGQIQVTHSEIRDPQEGGMFVRTMYECLEESVVSIVNENDALSDEEIKKVRYGGDNDGLARYVAATLRANRLLLLTSDVEGLLNEEGNVEKEIDSRKIKKAQEWAGDIEKNGMGTKVQAAISAAASGVRVHIANPRHSISSIIAKNYGTYFAPHTPKQKT